MNPDRHSIERYGEVLKAFLISPHDRARFDKFFELCLRDAASYLRFLQRKGYRLPLEDHAGENPLADLAIDILGTFLQSRPNEPFFIVYEYFQRHGEKDFKEAQPWHLWNQFSILLRGYIRKEITRLKAQADPQRELLVRRFKEILSEPPFNRHNEPHRTHTWVRRENRTSNSHADQHVELTDRVPNIVMACYHSATSRTEWVHSVFADLESEEIPQPCVNHYELVSAAVAVNLEGNLLNGWNPTPFMGPEYSLIASSFKNAEDLALQHLREKVLRRFIDKGRITADCARSFEGAFQFYLMDLMYSGSADPLPVYFRKVMPDTPQDQYLSDYKYVFETVISEGHSIVAEQMKWEST